MPSRSAIAATSFAVWFASHGWSTVEPWTARIIAMSSSAICDGPSSPIDTPACEPREAHGRAADRRHADEVVRAAEERGERRGEGPPAARLEPDGGRDHLLLGDVHLEVALGMRLREHLGERRVGDLAVEGDDVAARGADRGERVAVRLARRHLLAELVARQLERPGLEAVRLARARAASARGAGRARRRAPRSPPRGRRAACRASRSRPRRPRRPCPSAWRRRSPSAGRSAPRRPSTPCRSARRRARRSRSRASPKARARSASTPVSRPTIVSPRWPSRLTSTTAVRLSRA